jgi:hypothetical protein
VATAAGVVRCPRGRLHGRLRRRGRGRSRGRPRGRSRGRPRPVRRQPRSPAARIVAACCWRQSLRPGLRSRAGRRVVAPPRSLAAVAADRPIPAISSVLRPPTPAIGVSWPTGSTKKLQMPVPADPMARFGRSRAPGRHSAPVERLTSGRPFATLLALSTRECQYQWDVIRWGPAGTLRGKHPAAPGPPVAHLARHSSRRNPGASAACPARRTRSMSQAIGDRSRPPEEE